MRMLVLEPGYCPYISHFPSAEEACRQVIKGPVSRYLPFGNDVILLLAGTQQQGQPHNRIIAQDLVVCGRALICGWNGQKEIELTRKQADRYYRAYLYPERVADDWNSVLVVPVNPRVKPVDERFGRKPGWLER